MNEIKAEDFAWFKLLALLPDIPGSETQLRSQCRECAKPGAEDGVWQVLAVLGPDLTPAEWAAKLNVNVRTVLAVLKLLQDCNRDLCAKEPSNPGCSRSDCPSNL